MTIKLKRRRWIQTHWQASCAIDAPRTIFLSDPVPEHELAQILKCAVEAPSGYNLQPWRFVVVRDAANRKSLRSAAFDQEKVGEAPVVIVAFGQRKHWAEHAEEIFQESARRGALNSENLDDQRKSAIDFVSKLPAAVWLNRHVMIAFTYLMLAAEALGWDTAPMEGFDPAKVARVLDLPDDAEVIALLAIGKHDDPDAKYPGRLSPERVVHMEKFGNPWSAPASGKNEGN
jgi:nitroreductase